jgi:hypothetical protein
MDRPRMCLQISTDQKVGGSSPSERTSERARSSVIPAETSASTVAEPVAFEVPQLPKRQAPSRTTGGDQ